MRLDKGSGSTKAYSFNLILTTIEGKSTRFDTLTPGRSWQVLSKKLQSMLDESRSEKSILEINKWKQTLVALFLCWMITANFRNVNTRVYNVQISTGVIWPCVNLVPIPAHRPQSTYSHSRCSLLGTYLCIQGISTCPVQSHKRSKLNEVTNALLSGCCSVSFFCFIMTWLFLLWRFLNSKYQFYVIFCSVHYMLISFNVNLDNFWLVYISPTLWGIFNCKPN